MYQWFSALFSLICIGLLGCITTSIIVIGLLRKKQGRGVGYQGRRLAKPDVQQRRLKQQETKNQLDEEEKELQQREMELRQIKSQLEEEAENLQKRTLEHQRIRSQLDKIGERFPKRKVDHRRTKKEQEGEAGELRIVAQLMSLGETEIIRNLYIPKDNGTYTEVDIMLLTTQGILVIESKNFGGWIFGTDTHKTWTQSFSSTKKFPFDNPIHQNLNHIKALSQYLQLNQQAFHSFVIFGERCTLKSIQINYHRATVISIHDLRKTLSDFYASHPTLFTQEGLTGIKGQLEACCNPTWEVREQHVRHVEAQQRNAVR